MSKQEIQEWEKNAIRAAADDIATKDFQVSTYDSSSKSGHSYSARKYNKAGADNARSSLFSYRTATRSAVIQLPLRYDANCADSTLPLSWQGGNSVSVSTSSPVTQNVNLSLSGQCRQRGRTGYSKSSASIQYHINEKLRVHSGLTVGNSLSSKESGSEITFGASRTDPNTSAALMIYLPMGGRESLLKIPRGSMVNGNCHFNLSVKQRLSDIFSLQTLCVVFPASILQPYQHNQVPSVRVVLYCNAQHSWNVAAGYTMGQPTVGANLTFRSFPWQQLTAATHIVTTENTSLSTRTKKSTQQQQRCQLSFHWKGVGPKNVAGWQWSITWRTLASSTAPPTSPRTAAVPSLPSPPSSSFQMAIEHHPLRGMLLWIWSYTIGDLTLRVPISIVTIAATTAAAAAGTGSSGNSSSSRGSLVQAPSSSSVYALSLTAIYLSIVSKLIMAGVSEMLHPRRDVGGGSGARGTKRMDPATSANRSTGSKPSQPQKQDHQVYQQQQQEQQQHYDRAKETARQQQALMKRQANTRERQQTEKSGGLLILQALYYCAIGESSNEIAEAATILTDKEPLRKVCSWDVTIPLQFWIETTESTLTLVEGSKKDMLGFYDVRAEAEFLSLSRAKGAATPSPGQESDVSTPSLAASLTAGTKSWFQGFWQPFPGNKLNKGKRLVSARPKLFVKYSVGGIVSETTIDDDDVLHLPPRQQ